MALAISLGRRNLGQTSPNPSVGCILVKKNVIVGRGMDLAKNGIKEDELERSLKPLLNGIDQQLRQNSYWLRTVALSSQEFPQKLQWAKTMVEDYKSITLDEVNQLASKYLNEGKSVSIKVIPEE